jgi:phage gpG-like protein
MPGPYDPAEVPSATRTILARLKAKLKEKRPILKKIGLLIEARSQLAFKEQRLGSYDWPERYPSMGTPFINVAGAASDLRFSDNVKSRRFDRRPVLEDQGQLKRSVTTLVVGDDHVVVGTSGTPYATIHQSGGLSEMPVTQAMRDNLAKVLKRAKKAKDPRLAALKKLGFLFAVDKLTTRVWQRPFIGITPEDADQMVADIVDEMSI